MQWKWIFSPKEIPLPTALPALLFPITVVYLERKITISRLLGKPHCGGRNEKKIVYFIALFIRIQAIRFHRIFTRNIFWITFKCRCIYWRSSKGRKYSGAFRIYVLRQLTLCAATVRRILHSNKSSLFYSTNRINPATLANIIPVYDYEDFYLNWSFFNVGFIEIICGVEVCNFINVSCG